MSCRHYHVYGRVQGVVFRASTRETANALGLTGWVRNTEDGRVELVACGEPTRLAELEAWLHQGPPHAQVKDVAVTGVGEQAYGKFSIRT